MLKDYNTHILPQINELTSGYLFLQYIMNCFLCAPQFGNYRKHTIFWKFVSVICLNFYIIMNFKIYILWNITKKGSAVFIMVCFNPVKQMYCNFSI